jgi:phosphatidate cytidylyltransferase
MTQCTPITKVPLPSRYILPFILLQNIIWNKRLQSKIIIGLFIIIWTNDTFAYIVGKSIGKKLFERISPKKQ